MRSDVAVGVHPAPLASYITYAHSVADHAAMVPQPRPERGVLVRRHAQRWSDNRPVVE